MSNQKFLSQVEKAVDSIISDIKDRSGLSNEWDNIDSEIKLEIMEEWIELIKTALAEKKVED